MSALAARRAAEAARLSQAATPTAAAPSPTVVPGPSHIASAPAALSAPLRAGRVASTSSAPRRSPPARKRKQSETHQEEPRDAQRQGYAAPVEAPRVKRSARYYSPGAPVEDGHGASSGGATDDDDDEASSGDEQPEAGPSSRSSPYRNGRAEIASMPAASTFAPLPGVNIHVVDEEEAGQAGLDSRAVILSLDRRDTLVIAGIYNVTPLQGGISLLSSTITPGASHTVFAPTSHPLPVLSAAGPAGRAPLLDRLRLPVTFATAGRSVFLLQAAQTGLDGLRGDAVPGFSNIWLDDRGAWGLRGVHPVIGSFPAPVYPHVEPPSWTAGLAALAVPTVGSAGADADAPVVLVKGAKRSGKSSFARATLNQLLATRRCVAWLECDLGQGEFGCGGLVGLWVLDTPVFAEKAGPPFTHPRVPAHATFLGELSPQSCPDGYVSAVRDALLHYRYHVQYAPAVYASDAGATHDARRDDAVPLVVNTQGWVKGLGDELLRAVELLAEPTHVFAFDAPADDVPAPDAPDAGWTTSPPWATGDLPPASTRAITHVLQAAPVSPLQARYTAADLRALATVAYLHASLEPSAGVSWHFEAPIIGLPCYEVALGSAHPIREVYIVGEGAADIVADDLPLALGGSIVALLAKTDSDAGALYERGRPVLDGAAFVALALVRAVRAADDGLRVQLVSPVGAAVLSEANVLVRNGAMELPTCGMLDWADRARGHKGGLAGVPWDEAPFFDASGVEVVGGERRRFRRNLMRKGL